MTQGEFEDHSGTKKELYDFLETENAVLPFYGKCNAEYLEGCMTGSKKYITLNQIVKKSIE